AAQSSAVRVLHREGRTKGEPWPAHSLSLWVGRFGRGVGRRTFWPETRMPGRPIVSGEKIPGLIVGSSPLCLSNERDSRARAGLQRQARFGITRSVLARVGHPPPSHGRIRSSAAALARHRWTLRTRRLSTSYPISHGQSRRLRFPGHNRLWPRYTGAWRRRRRRDTDSR